MPWHDFLIFIVSFVNADAYWILKGFLLWMANVLINFIYGYKIDKINIWQLDILYANFNDIFSALNKYFVHLHIRFLCARNIKIFWCGVDKKNWEFSMNSWKKILLSLYNIFQRSFEDQQFWIEFFRNFYLNPRICNKFCQIFLIFVEF